RSRRHRRRASQETSSPCRLSPSCDSERGRPFPDSRSRCRGGGSDTPCRGRVCAGSSCHALLADVLLSEVLADREFNGRPEFCPFIGGELREGDALWNSYLVPIDENHIVVTGQHAQLLVDA